MFRRFPFPPVDSWRSLARCLGLLGIFVAAGAADIAPATREYDLKAVFLYRFASFVEWPREPAAESQPRFVIGVLGDDPFGPVLPQVVEGERIRGSVFVVRHCRTLAEARECRILFIANSEMARLPRILAELQGRPILTVGDHPRFVDAGGMIAFSTGTRLQLHVNLAAARAAGLSVSSKLLRVAHVQGEAR